MGNPPGQSHSTPNREWVGGSDRKRGWEICPGNLSRNPVVPNHLGRILLRPGSDDRRIQKRKNNRDMEILKYKKE